VFRIASLVRRLSRFLVPGLWLAGILPITAAPKAALPATNSPAIPSVLVISPLFATPGSTVQLLLRGQHLTNVTALSFTQGQPPLQATVQQRKKLELGKNPDAKMLGDTQVEVSVRLPEEAAPGTNQISVTTPAGTSPARPWIVLPAAGIIPEQEPNGGLAQAQPLVAGRTLAGRIQEAADVDVFRWRGQRGEKLEIEVWAARGASALDPVVTLLDAKGRVLAMADDTNGSRDPVLRQTLPADDDYLLSVVDAYDRGGQGYGYLLSVRVLR
jgi:hypothetical protein